MTIKASARSAMIIAAGFLVGFAAAPLPAMAVGADADTAAASKSENATSGKSVRQDSRSLKKRYAHRNTTHAAAKSDDSNSAAKPESKKAEEKQVADTSGGTPPGIPAWLANANAQMTAADAPSDTAKGMSAAMSEKANTVLQAAAEKPADAEASADATVVASDQLNEVDRALHANPSEAASTQTVEAASTQTVAMASVKPASDGAAQAATNDSSTLDKTSLIGKIFIAFGALLTMASAARMFMA
ncbi:hypothetical protein CQ14_03885 [Bradyrhizobium lablabi]|uniref:Uncharacterized protein n=2 Tax=Bradyrhizobium lablabi TaxID=722472 RepID=A0A0R3MBN3_9BRAD|nr:hypothetical protein CQ14_03885 [Bradyrhizobium lablabi]